MLERTAQNRVIFGTITKKEKSSKPAWLLDFCGGDGGIRTHVALITPKRFRVVDRGDSAGSFRGTGVPPGKPENPLLMRVCGPKRASGRGFPGVEHFVPEEPGSLVNSLVKTQSAADGRLFYFAGKGLIRSILLVIVFIFISLFRWCRKFAGLSCDFLFL